MPNMTLFALVVALCFLEASFAFNMRTSTITRSVARIKMEYIPDGISKEKWEAIKKKEAELAKIDKGAVGITKFKSRSFEAFQKSGGKNLFSNFDKDTPLNERPYMRRGNGSIDGEDLKKKGLAGAGQGKEMTKSAEDLKYEKLEKQGLLRSSTFSMPWTNEAAAKVTSAKFEAANAERAALKAKRAAAGGVGSAVKKVVPPLKKGAVAPPAPVEEPPKKKFFGLF